MTITLSGTKLEQPKEYFDPNPPKKGFGFCRGRANGRNAKICLPGQKKCVEFVFRPFLKVVYEL